MPDRPIAPPDDPRVAAMRDILQRLDEDAALERAIKSLGWKGRVKMSDWTPGPWASRDFPDDWDVGGPEDGSSPAFCIGTDDDVVAVVYGDYHDRDQGKNDARLIAATPELYEALTALLREVKKAGFESAHDYGWPTVIPAADAALAKARGES